MQKVFLIEDDASLAKMYERVFRLNKCEVFIAHDGDEALNMLASMTELPNVIVLDAMLPSMTGHDLLKRIKSDPRLAGIATVVLTNSLQEDWREKFIKSGADQFLIKMDSTTEDIVNAAVDLIGSKHESNTPQS